MRSPSMKATGTNTTMVEVVVATTAAMVVVATTETVVTKRPISSLSLAS